MDNPGRETRRSVRSQQDGLPCAAGTGGDRLVRGELCGEAIRLGRLLCELMPDDAEVRGLLALMLLHDARRDARVDDEGRYVPLDEQDRTRWDLERIVEGLGTLDYARSSRAPTRSNGPSCCDGSPSWAASAATGNVCPSRSVVRCVPSQGGRKSL
ncbi:DUF6596 domain-containing protein [Streptomyces sp. NPDC054841]